MKRAPLSRAIALASLSAAFAAAPSMATAAFFEDSKATLELRNFYMNQDTRHSGDAGKKSGNKTNDEWGQGFIFNYQSGFTEGTIGVGVDVYAALGLRLDGGHNRSPDMFPQKRNGHSEREFTKFAPTAKFKLSESELRVGGLMPRFPAIQANLEGRMLPQIFTGGLLTSKDISGLTMNLMHLDRVNNRGSSDYEGMGLDMRGGHNKGINIKGKTTSNSFDMGHLNYQLTDSLSAGYSFSRLDNLYKQHLVNGVHTWNLGEQRSLRTDLRIARSKNDGRTNIDNKAFSGMVTYSFGFNKLGLGYQKMTGDTGYAFVAGTDPYLANFVANRDFAAKDEKSWQVRHDYNFAGLGIPGLTMFNRYVKGTGADLGKGNPEGREWERDFDVTYAFQEGALKNFSVRWRNSTIRSNVTKDLDENRIILTYKLPLL